MVGIDAGAVVLALDNVLTGGSGPRSVFQEVNSASDQGVGIGWDSGTTSTGASSVLISARGRIGAGPTGRRNDRAGAGNREGSGLVAVR